MSDTPLTASLSNEHREPGRGGHWLAFRNSRKPPDNQGPAFGFIRAGKAVGEQFGNSFPNLRCGCGKLFAPQGPGGRDEEVEIGNHYQGPDKDSEKLSDKLFARVGPE